MNILLTAINAKYIHSNLAVYSLRACAGEYRDDVELAEYTINNQKDYILEELYKRKPDVLCFSCYIWNIDYVTDIAREYKKLCPSVPREASEMFQCIKYEDKREVFGLKIHSFSTLDRIKKYDDSDNEKNAEKPYSIKVGETKRTINLYAIATTKFQIAV